MLVFHQSFSGTPLSLHTLQSIGDKRLSLFCYIVFFFVCLLLEYVMLYRDRYLSHLNGYGTGMQQHLFSVLSVFRYQNVELFDFTWIDTLLTNKSTKFGALLFYYAMLCGAVSCQVITHLLLFVVVFNCHAAVTVINWSLFPSHLSCSLCQQPSFSVL